RATWFASFRPPFYCSYFCLSGAQNPLTEHLGAYRIYNRGVAHRVYRQCGVKMASLAVVRAAARGMRNAFRIRVIFGQFDRMPNDLGDRVNLASIVVERVS